MDKLSLRRAFGAFATGVTIVTTGDEAPHGMTANSFTSVSLDPPLLLICVRRDAVMHGALHKARSFGVSVLSADQEAVARYFADSSRPLGKKQFDAVGWHAGTKTGVPLIKGAMATFECRLHSCHEGGDHTIFVGLLLSLECGDATADALIFHQGKFLSRSGVAT